MSASAGQSARRAFAIAGRLPLLAGALCVFLALAPAWAGAASSNTASTPAVGGVAAPTGAAANGAVSSTAPPATATPPATTPATSTPAPVGPASTAGSTTTPPPGTTVTRQQAKPSSGGLSTGAILAAALGGLLALACLAWAVFRLGAFEPHWLLSLRHSIAEAGFRASATWAEFTDWIRLGH
jgi:hypothetical protein